MTSRADAEQAIVDYVLADFTDTVGEAPEEMMEQIHAGIGASATLAVNALVAAGILELDPS